MAATSHPQATMLAVDILRQGGNAIDAGIAAVALLCVIEPQATGIGGDCFAIYAPQGRRPIGLNGSGRAPARATLQWYQDQGIEEIATQSPHAVTLPGAVDAWCRLHGDHGTLPFDQLLAPAIDAAENGYLVTDRVAWDWKRLSALLAADEVSRETMLVDGGAPAAGTRHAQPKLGATLRDIARHGRAGFYEGRVAHDIVARLQELGGLHTLEDLAATQCDDVDVLSSRYRGWDVCELPPNGQGITALMILAALSKFDLPALSAADRIHLLAEITKAAYRRRDDLVGDPAFSDIPVDRMLSPQEAERMCSAVDMSRASSGAPVPELEHRDTTYLCIVDKDRNSLSLINSLFGGFGTGISTRETGIVFQNRGTSFRIRDNHPNAMGPGKRPMHTIIPGMLCAGEQAVMPFGVMGGHYQPVGHTTLLTNIIDFGMNPQDALAEPRSFAYDGELQLEPTIGKDVVAELARRGHAVSEPPSPLGGGQAIWIDESSGTLCGGSDPRKDGCALGY